MARPDPRQLDLFSTPIAAPAKVSTHSAAAALLFRSVDPEDLDDAKLLLITHLAQPLTIWYK